MKEDVMPKDFTSAVIDIKLAVLQAHARTAQLSNVEALKLYFFVGSYISKKTRSAKWGTGAINALPERLQVELPGLKGFSVSGIKRMRLFFERWIEDETIRPIALADWKWFRFVTCQVTNLMISLFDTCQVSKTAHRQ